MKKTLLILAIFSFGIISSQNDDFFDFGAVVGFNYGSNGDLSSDFTTNNLSSDKKSGYHAGLYFQFSFKDMYIRPEVVYTKTKSNYNSAIFDMAKIDIPVLVGFTIIKPISLFVGPSFQYALQNDLKGLEGFDFNDLDVENEFAINAQLGLAIKIGKQIRLDARYEKGISENLITLQDNTSTSGLLTTLDTKPDQFTFSISLQL
jgi:hypothetical protein